MGIELFLFAAFGAMICWGIGDFLIQRSVRKIGDLETLAFIGLIGFIGLTPFVINDLPLLLASQNFAVLLFIGILVCIVAMFNLEALKKGKLSVIDVVLELELPVTIVLGFVLFAEFPSPLQFILIIPIFIGIILISIKKGFSFKAHHLLEKGVLFALVAGIGLGLVDVFTGFAARSISPLVAIWLPWLIVFIVPSIAVLARRDGKKMFANAWKFKWIIIAMGIIDTIAWVFYAFSMSKINIGVVTAITESYPVIAVIFGIFVNKEKITKFQVIGAVLTICASIVLAVTLL